MNDEQKIDLIRKIRQEFWDNCAGAGVPELYRTLVMVEDVILNYDTNLEK